MCKEEFTQKTNKRRRKKNVNERLLIGNYRNVYVKWNNENGKKLPFFFDNVSLKCEQIKMSNRQNYKESNVCCFFLLFFWLLNFFFMLTVNCVNYDRMMDPKHLPRKIERISESSCVQFYG